MDLTDQPEETRAGEELDPAKIADFLSEAIPCDMGSITLQQFPRGYSNLTYLVKAGEEEFVLRRPPFGTKAKTAHDMGREFRVLRALHPVFPYCPRPLAYTEDTSILGCPFYLMERIKGIILRKDLPSGLSFTPARARTLCERFLDVHLQLHAIDYEEIGLENFGKPQGYVSRQVSGWSDRYRAARTEDAPDFEEVMAWIKAETPPDLLPAAIIHNDYRLDNVVLSEKDPMKIIGVLDWEMATVGDPLMDLGNTLAYWVERGDPPELQAIRVMPTHMEGALTREEMVSRYLEKSGRSVVNFHFYYCFGLFRLAVIAQQIYYRFYHGQTRDERFKTLIFVVKTLESTARKVIQNSRSQRPFH
jgi:aminoglycoside phosphotransferase (APT) family kinase protein